MAARAGPSFGVPGFARGASAVVLLMLLVLVLRAQLSRLGGWARPSLLVAADTRPGQTEMGSIKPGEKSKLGGYVAGQHPSRLVVLG